eukprot:5680568-Alexandrium_andersonii.AAC.1
MIVIGCLELRNVLKCRSLEYPATQNLQESGAALPHPIAHAEANSSQQPQRAPGAARPVLAAATIGTAPFVATGTAVNLAQPGAANEATLHAADVGRVARLVGVGGPSVAKGAGLLQTNMN